MIRFKEQLEIVKKLKLIDDFFFDKIFEDKDTCEEVLQIILQDSNLKVIEVYTQDTIKNLQGRSVRLDAFCKLGNGKFCNIEVQKANNDNHLRRVRYNEACITANITPTSTKFKEVPDVYMIYISRFDMFGKKKTIYHTNKVVLETGEIIDDGVHEIYVNTAVNDGTLIAELMQCFEQTDVQNSNFPKLTKRIAQFKNPKEGALNMCKLVDEYAEKYAKEEKVNSFIDLVLENELSITTAAHKLNMSLEDFQELINQYKEDKKNKIK